MPSLRTTTLLMLVAASAAFAHAGVKDPDVMARMEGMSRTAAAAKTLGEMVKGQQPFDAEAAQAAAARIADEAAEIPDLFRNAAQDPKSEALPLIWERYEDFTDKAAAMGTAAADARIETEADLARAFKAIGATCQSCHAVYRE